MQRVYRTVKTGIYYDRCYFLSLFIQTPPITFLVPSVVDQLESFICLKEHLVGLFEKQKNNRLLSKLIVFLFLFGLMLKEVKLFRGIVLSAPGTILGREKIKSLGRAAAARKRSHLFFGKISRACFCLIPSVRDCRSGTTVCLSSSSFLPFFPLNFPPMTHFRFQVTCYADKYLTSL